MLSAIWKVISLILGLGAFLTVGTMALMNGEELIWAVGKAVIGFFVCWIVFGYLGGMLLAISGRSNSENNSNSDSISTSGN